MSEKLKAVQGKKVRLRFVSTLKQLVDRDQKILEIEGEATIGDLLRLIQATFSKDISRFLFENDSKTIRNDILILVNDTDIGALDGIETALSENDEVILMPISHGG